MNGLSAVGGIENVMCYDAKNKVLVAHRGNDAKWAAKAVTRGCPETVAYRVSMVSKTPW